MRLLLSTLLPAASFARAAGTTVSVADNSYAEHSDVASPAEKLGVQDKGVQRLAPVKRFELVSGTENHTVPIYSHVQKLFSFSGVVLATAGEKQGAFGPGPSAFYREKVLEWGCAYDAVASIGFPGPHVLDGGSGGISGFEGFVPTVEIESNGRLDVSAFPYHDVASTGWPLPKIPCSSRKDAVGSNFSPQEYPGLGSFASGRIAPGYIKGLGKHRVDQEKVSGAGTYNVNMSGGGALLMGSSNGVDFRGIDGPIPIVLGPKPFDVSGAGRVAQAGEAPGFFAPTAFFDEGVVQWGGMGFPWATGKDLNPVERLFKGGTEAIYAFEGFIWSGASKVSSGGPDFYPYDKGFGNHEVQHPIIDINVCVPALQAPDNRFDFGSRGGSRLKEAGIEDTAGSFATLDNEGGAVVDEATDFGSAWVGSPGWTSCVARFLMSVAERWGSSVANMFGWLSLLALAGLFAHSNPNKAKGKGRRSAQSTTKIHSRASLLFAMPFLLKRSLGENLDNLQGSSLHLPEEPMEEAIVENHLRGSEEHRKLESSVLFDLEPAMARTKQTARKKAGYTRAAKTKAAKTKAAKTKAVKTKAAKTKAAKCDMSQFVGSWLYVSTKCPGDVFVEISCDDMKSGPCYYYEVHRDEDLCAFGTSAMQAFDPRHYLDLDECTIGLDRQVHLTQYSEGREKCDSENPRELSVKIRRDFLNDQIIIYFTSSNTEGAPRVALRLRNSRHLMSPEDHCVLEDQIANEFGRRLQCTDPCLWNNHLPWEELTDARDNVLDVDRSINRQTWRQECTAEFNRRMPQLGGNQDAVGETFGDRSCWGLTDRKSGLCTCDMFNVFESSDPKPKSAIFDPLGERILQNGLTFQYDMYDNLTSPTSGHSMYKSWIESDDWGNSNLEIPGAVLFPRETYDVFAAVEFARKNGLQISVKTSGHSYSGSGTRRNTLHLNMRKYRKYADVSDKSYGVVSCVNTSPNSAGEDLSEDLSDLPCYLAHKRKKSRCEELQQDCGKDEWNPGYLEIGGGQNWAEAYSAVHHYNQEGNKAEHEKYHVVGGNTATVSPNGWGLQGGLSGTTLGRRFGFGVDQPLMYELMLATGQIVRFGPTKTEHVEGHYVPKTKRVEGVCLSNPKETNEINWVWNKDHCPQHMTDDYFMGLWRAVRGGGGGFGINLKIYFQLHHYPGKLNYLTFPWNGGNPKDHTKNGGIWFHENNLDRSFCGAVPPLLPHPQYQTAWNIFNEFNLYFGLFPNVLNEKFSDAGLSDDSFVSEVDAYSCGAPANGPFNRYCFGEGAKAQTDAWERYLDLETVKGNLTDAGIQDADIERMKTCHTVTEFEDYLEMVVLYGNRARINSDDHDDHEDPDREKYIKNKPGDTPAPFYASTMVFSVPLIVPRDYILANMDVAIDKYNPFYNAFGGFSEKTSDQTDALSHAYRNGGYWTLLILTEEVLNVLTFGGTIWPDGHSKSVLDDEFFSEEGDFRKMYGDITLGNFPGFVSHNHLSLSPRGPMKKDDYKKACDMNQTQTVVDEECMSAQEIVFGTEMLATLEKTQEKVDPTGMLICRNCINDKVKHKYALFQAGGGCSDSNGKVYSSTKYLVEWEDFGEEWQGHREWEEDGSSAGAACLKMCEEEKQNKFFHTGFTFRQQPLKTNPFHHEYVNCWCHYDHMKLSMSGAHHIDGFKGYDHFFLVGTGPVTTTSDDTLSSCYKHNEYMKQ